MSCENCEQKNPGSIIRIEIRDTHFGPSYYACVNCGRYILSRNSSGEARIIEVEGEQKEIKDCPRCKSLRNLAVEWRQMYYNMKDLYGLSMEQLNKALLILRGKKD